MRQFIYKIYLLICLIWPFSAFCTEYELIGKSIPHIDDPQKKVEYFLMKLRTLEKLPVIIFVHGYYEDKLGAGYVIENGTVNFLIDEGYLVVTVSQPGFGKSDGPPDYCGPYTQRAVLSVIESLRMEYADIIDPDKIVLWGESRGAIVVSNIVARNKNVVAAAILQSGVYDMRSVTYDGIIRYFAREAGAGADRIKERSAMFYADAIKLPVLMLHGYYDDRSPIQQAIQFYEAIMKAGSKATMAIFPSKHQVPRSDKRMMIRRFLKNLFNGEYEND